MNAKVNTGISLGWFIGILAPVAIGVFVWGVTVSTNIFYNTQSIKVNKENLEKHENKIEKVDDKVDENFKEIQIKLDRIIENQNR